MIRMYRYYNSDNLLTGRRFANFFHQLDTLKSGVFLFVTSGGIAATKRIREGGDRAAITVQKALDEADNSDTDEETRPDALGNEG